MSDAERRLRESFRNPPPDAPRGPGCKPPERSFEAVSGRASAEEREAFAAHAATCAACAVEWRLARAFLEETGSAAPARPAPRWRWAAAAAAVVLVALVAVWLPRESGPDGDPAFRSGTGEGPASAVPENAALPREAFRLVWEAAGPGFRYDLRAFDARLRILHEERRLVVPEAMIPAEALSSLGPDAVVLWQVEAIDPEGNRVVSETFRARVAR